jgi:hypothetical protein
MPKTKDSIAASRDWLTVFHFPSYAPTSTREKCPVPGETDHRQPVAADLIHGCLMGTVLTLTSQRDHANITHSSSIISGKIFLRYPH